MKFLSILFITFFNSFDYVCLLEKHYKRMMLEGSEWTVFISKTTTSQMQSLVECGAACSGIFGSGCDVFSLHSSSKSCHVGYLSNTNTEYLTDDESGSQPVYIDFGIEKSA